MTIGRRSVGGPAALGGCQSALQYVSLGLHWEQVDAQGAIAWEKKLKFPQVIQIQVRIAPAMKLPKGVVRRKLSR